MTITTSAVLLVLFSVLFMILEISRAASHNDDENIYIYALYCHIVDLSLQYEKFLMANEPKKTFLYLSLMQIIYVSFSL